MQALMLSLLGLGMLLCLGASVGMWVGVIRGKRSGRPIVTAEPRIRYPGGLAEILIAVGMVIVVSIIAAQALGGRPTGAGTASATSAAEIVRLIVINSVAFAVASVAVVLWMRLQGFKWRESGLHFDFRHLAIGGRALVLLLPPVMILQAALASLIPYHHPVLDILRQPQPLLIIAAMAISSTLVAPLTEEFFFRGLLQGWLERLAGVGASGVVHADHDARVAHIVTERMPETEPYFPPRAVDPTTDAVPAIASHAEPAFAPRPVWPMVVSSAAFAIVHLGQGPAPITLFFLAIGIGYLYRQTGSIWPGIVVHMGLNGLTTTVTILTMFE